MIKLFTLRSPQDNFARDQQTLNDFIWKHRILQIETAYVGVGDTLWSVAVYYELPERIPKEVEAGHSPKPGVGFSEVEKARLERLKSWRRICASKLGIAPYRIASDAELELVSKEYPKDLHALSALKGFGNHKVNMYGSLILENLKDP